MRHDLDERAVGTDRIVEEVGERFGLGIPDSWSDLGGSRTANLRLSYPHASVVARIHRGSTSVGRLAATQAARIASAEAGIPAVVPTCTPVGEPIVRLSGGRLAELERYVPAGVRMNTPDLLRIGFGLLARLHDALRAADLPEQARFAPYANHLPRDRAPRACAEGADRVRGWGVEELCSFVDRATDHLEAVERAELPLLGDLLVQVAHGDFWDDNVMFAGESVTAVFDFDFMSERPRIDDLALAIYFHLLQRYLFERRGLPGAEEREQVSEFVAAYDESAAIPLSAEELAALPLAVAGQPAWSLGRWIRELDEPHARAHARAAAEELAVAEAVLLDLPRWQQAMTSRRRAESPGRG